MQINRRWFQFSFRGLLVLMAIASLYFAWEAKRWRSSTPTAVVERLVAALHEKDFEQAGDCCVLPADSPGTLSMLSPPENLRTFKENLEKGVATVTSSTADEQVTFTLERKKSGWKVVRYSVSGNNGDKREFDLATNTLLYTMPTGTLYVNSAGGVRVSSIAIDLNNLTPETTCPAEPASIEAADESER